MESKLLEILAYDRIRIFAYLVVFSAFAVISLTSELQAQGKLRRVSESVRNIQPQNTSKPPKSNRDENRNDSNENRRSKDDNQSNRKDQNSNRNGHRSNSSNHNSRHDDSHRRSYRRSRPSGFVFVSQRSSYPVPVVVPVVHSCSTAPPPVFIDQPCLVPSPSQVYESSVVEGFDPLPACPISEPMDATSVQEVVIQDAMLHSDWFHSESSRIWALIGSDFDGITIGGLGLHLQESGGLGLESSVMTLRESSDSYRDHLWIGDVNMVYEVLSRGDVRGRMGLGVNWLSDAWGAEAGFNLTAGIDLRLTERILLTAEGDLGSLGDADYFHGRINLARRFESSELMFGIDHFDIGGAVITSFFTGLQFRF